MTADTTMTDVDTSTATIMSRAEKWDKHMEKVAADAKKYADVAVAREDFGLAEIADQLRALAAERDELSMKLNEAAHTAKAALDRCDELERLAGAMGDTLDKAEAYIPELRKIMDQVGIEVNMRLEVDGEEIEVGQDISNRIKRDLAALKAYRRKGE